MEPITVSGSAARAQVTYRYFVPATTEDGTPVDTVLPSACVNRSLCTVTLAVSWKRSGLIAGAYRFALPSCSLKRSDAVPLGWPGNAPCTGSRSAYGGFGGGGGVEPGNPPPPAPWVSPPE